ncbi:MAG: hypothetical protein AAF533_12280 [Acidobacteriota bacterium]
MSLPSCSRRVALAVSLLLGLATVSARAAVVPLDVPYNADVVVNDGSGMNDPMQDPIDLGLIASGNYCFMTQTVADTAATPPVVGNGLPDDAVFPAVLRHPDIQLGWDNADDGFNVLRVQETTITQGLAATPDQYIEAHLFATSGNGTSTIDVVPIYDDGLGTMTTLFVPDWFDDPVETDDVYILINDLDRMQPGVGPGTPFMLEDRNDPAIFGFRVVLDGGRTLTGLELTIVGSAVCNLFGTVAVTAEPPESCCMPDGSCTDLDPTTCRRMGGEPEGVGTTCATTVCPVEACCMADGSCTDLSPAACMTMGGAPQGMGTTCATTTCPVQACCMAGGACTDLEPTACMAMGGVPQGMGTTCATTTCPVEEACCLAGGTCMDVFPDECTAMLGIPQGRGTDCASAGCSDLEACCFADGTCMDLNEASCLASGGMARGVGTRCATETCLPLEACCFPDDSCMELDPADCFAAGGLPDGPGTDCTNSPRCATTSLPGWAPNGGLRPGDPLRIIRAVDDLTLSWGLGCSADAIDYSVHEGLLGNWYSHESLACDTAGAITSVTVTPGAGNRYYLVVPVTAAEEGSYGLDFAGLERPASPTTPCQPMVVTGCP